MKENELEKTLKALANRRRILILRALKNTKELTVGDIAEKIKLSFKATSKHLSILSAADIIEKEQRSSQSFYKICSNLNEPARRIISIL